MDNDMDNDDADRKIAALGVSDDPRVREYIAGSYGNGRTETPSDWFMKVTEAEIREAAELVAAFGLGTYQMEKGIETIARTQRHIVEWARFREISGGEFDEKLIPEVHYITGEAVEEWRRNVAASRDVRLSEWAEAVAGDAIGNQVLGQILSLLHFKKVEVEREAAKSQETPRES
jgi:hypothetical protein